MLRKPLPPHLLAEWHPTKNGDLSPDSSILTLATVVTWHRKDCGHDTRASISSRLKNRKCNICINKELLVGYNDFATRTPEFVHQWHPTKNGEHTPYNTFFGAAALRWWLCEVCGHEWEAAPDIRSRVKTGCIKCYQQSVRERAYIPEIGKEDLGSQYPAVAAQWHPTRNGELTVQDVFAKSDRKVWWLCPDCGHEWEASVGHRTLGSQGCPRCAGRVVTRGINDAATLYPHLLAEVHPTKNAKTLYEVTVQSREIFVWVCKNNHEWSTPVYQRTGKIPSGCGRCSNRISAAEKFITEALQNAGEKLLTSDRSVLGDKELDIYLPDRKLAIEFNGLYWHTESRGKNRAYHHDKWLRCSQAGVQLIQIWEDDWRRSPELVMSMLLHKIGISTAPRLHARTLHASEIDSAEATAFLASNHIQGSIPGSYQVGLKDANGALHAVMVLRLRQEKEYELARYATDSIIPGGFTKLLKFVTGVAKVDRLITFSDNTVSDGGLYLSNGFRRDGEIRPDYMYVVNQERVHKFNYRLARFQNDPNLIWQPGLSESQLAALNGLERIWDAGKVRWVWEAKPLTQS